MYRHGHQPFCSSLHLCGPGSAVAFKSDMENGFHCCAMCSFTTNSLDILVSHVCKLHKAHPRFHVYCKSCLRSYTKWDSYRKHIQRGCKTVLSEQPEPSSPTRVAYLVEDMEVCLLPYEQSMTTESEAVPRQQWHEAAYTLQIKELYYFPGSG